MGEAAGITAEFDLEEQLSPANAAFRPASRKIVPEVARRTWLRGRRTPLRGSAECKPFSDAARPIAGFSSAVCD